MIVEIYNGLENAFPEVLAANLIAEQLLPFFKSKLDANDGGMKILGAISLVQCLTLARPGVYVELGAWKGISTLIARHFLPKETDIFVFDPLLHNFSEKVERVSFSREDWAKPSYLSLNTTGGFLFADDHQDVVERLLTAWVRGYDFVLFDDDYNGRADHRTFRNFVLQKLKADTALAEMMDFCIDKLVLLSRPDVTLPSDADPHWRDQAFVKLKKPMEKGWTMGGPSFNNLPG